MRFATCNEPWRDLPIEQVFEIVARLGFAGVELAPFTLAESVEQVSSTRRREIARTARDCGIEIVGLHWLFASPPGLHITTPDAVVRCRSVEYLKSLADFCGDVGGRVMVFGSPRQRSIEPPTTAQEAWKRARDVWAAAADACIQRQVTLCIEALGAAETNFINTLDEAARMADEIGTPAVDIMLDLKAMATMPDGVLGSIRRFGNRAKHVHANQPSGQGIGMPVPSEQPSVDCRAVLAALVEAGYDGWISCEPFDHQPDPTRVAQVAIETLQKAQATLQ